VTCEMHSPSDATRARRPEDGTTVVLSGEIDLTEAPVLADHLARLAETEGDLVIDAANVTFIDVAGCRVLLETAERLTKGARLVIRRPSAALLTVMRACGWATHPRVVLHLDAPR
jgi:anti-anti-sigma factor